MAPGADVSADGLPLREIPDGRSSPNVHRPRRLGGAATRLGAGKFPPPPIAPFSFEGRRRREWLVQSRDKAQWALASVREGGPPGAEDFPLAAAGGAEASPPADGGADGSGGWVPSPAWEDRNGRPLEGGVGSSRGLGLGWVGVESGMVWVVEGGERIKRDKGKPRKAGVPSHVMRVGPLHYFSIRRAFP